MSNARRTRRQTRLGRQPFAQIVYDDGRSLAWLARQVDTPYAYVVAVANGYSAPSQEFRRRIARTLGLPQAKAFTPEALAATYPIRRDSNAPLSREEEAMRRG